MSDDLKNKILLVIPSLNQDKYFRLNLARLFSAKELNISVVVMDGGSQDDTLEVIHQFEDKFKHWQSSPDNGQSEAINNGMRFSNSEEYVGWLNSDDIVFPEKLLFLADYLDRHPECAAVHGEAEIINKNGSIVGMYPTKSFNYRLFSHSCTISQPASLVRKSAWDAVGGLDENLHYAMDYDLWWKLAKIGKIGYVDEVIAQSRDHEETKTRRGHKEAIETCMVVLKRHIGYIPFLWVLRYHLDLNPKSLEIIDKEVSPRSWPFKKKLKYLILTFPFFFKINGIDGIIKNIFFYLFPRLIIRNN